MKLTYIFFIIDIVMNRDTNEKCMYLKRIVEINTKISVNISTVVFMTWILKDLNQVASIILMNMEKKSRSYVSVVERRRNNNPLPKKHNIYNNYSHTFITIISLPNTHRHTHSHFFYIHNTTQHNKHNIKTFQHDLQIFCIFNLIFKK